LERIESILVVVERGAGASRAIAKAIELGRKFAARIELFLCDAERAFALKHEYDTRGVDEARSASLQESRRYLERLRAQANIGDLQVAVDAMCESPLYEAVVHKVQESRPDVVIRRVAGISETQPTALSATDWALARTCPVPLLLTHGRAWQARPRIAAAVDISEAETPGLARSILRTADFLRQGCQGIVEVLHVCTPAVSNVELESQRAALRERVEEAGVQAQDLHVLVGEPADALPQFAAQRHYDVLILGALTHRKGFATDVGTLTGRLVECLGCDFLLVKPGSYVSPVLSPADP
jgi:universal stress protein E